MIEKHELEGRGFESWRLLVKQYAPTGGAYELDAMMALMTLPPCKSLNELPAAVAKFERDFKAYEQRTGRPFPEDWKIPAFLKLLPKSHLADMRWRFSTGMTDYTTMVASILSYSQHLRFDGSFARGDNDMVVDALARGGEKTDQWEEWFETATAPEISAFTAGLADGMASADPDTPVEHLSTDSPIDALYKNGKERVKERAET